MFSHCFVHSLTSLFPGANDLQRQRSCGKHISRIVCTLLTIFLFVFLASQDEAASCQGIAS